MKITGFLLILICLSGCTDSTPNISQLENLFSPSKTQSAQFAQANNAGAKRVTTADNYVGNIVVHAGTAGKTSKTADNYQLTIRKVSF